MPAHKSIDHASDALIKLNAKSLHLLIYLQIVLKETMISYACKIQMSPSSYRSESPRAPLGQVPVPRFQQRAGMDSPADLMTRLGMLDIVSPNEKRQLHE
jgi:hypothetical protein